MWSDARLKSNGRKRKRKTLSKRLSRRKKKQTNETLGSFAKHAPERGPREDEPTSGGENEGTYEREISNSFSPLTIASRFVPFLPLFFPPHSKLYSITPELPTPLVSSQHSSSEYFTKMRRVRASWTILRLPFRRHVTRDLRKIAESAYECMKSRYRKFTYAKELGFNLTSQNFLNFLQAILYVLNFSSVPRKWYVNAI